MSTDVVRVGLIGAGRIGRIHAANVARHIAGARLVAVADTQPAQAQACAQAYGAEVEPDYARLLARSDIDAVLICSATDSHAALIEAAAAAGKHIFCEKPIALDLERIDRALAAVERAGVMLQVGFNRRFDPSFRRVREAIGRGEIGEPWLARIISYDPAPPPLSYIAVSGGLFLDMAIHDFDMAGFLIGRPVREVFARASARVDPAIGAAGDVDTALTVLTFDDGTIASVENCRQASYGYDQRVEVLGSRGAVRAENHFPNAVTISDSAGLRRDPPLYFFLERYAESFLAELSAFVQAIASGGPAPVDGAAGRVPVVIALAARRSLELGRPVALEEVDPPQR